MLIDAHVQQKFPNYDLESNRKQQAQEVGEKDFSASAEYKAL